MKPPVTYTLLAALLLASACHDPCVTPPVQDDASTSNGRDAGLDAPADAPAPECIAASFCGGMYVYRCADGFATGFADAGPAERFPCGFDTRYTYPDESCIDEAQAARVFAGCGSELHWLGEPS